MVAFSVRPTSHIPRNMVTSTGITTTNSTVATPRRSFWHLKFTEREDLLKIITLHHKPISNSLAPNDFSERAALRKLTTARTEGNKDHPRHFALRCHCILRWSNPLGGHFAVDLAVGQAYCRGFRTTGILPCSDVPCSA